MRRLTVTGGFWPALLLVWLLDPQLLLPSALAAALHELGHLLALRLLGVSVRGLRLGALGAELAVGPLSYARELPAALAGPAASLLAAWLAARMGRYLFAGVSLALGLFNLLPIPPLDGHRALSALCALTLPTLPALRVPRWTAILAAGLLLGLSLAAFPRFGGVALPLTALYLAWQSVKNP